jgi:hypothetical protein
VILLTAVAAGILAGWLRARWRRRRLKSLSLSFIWLAILAFLPQLFAFQLFTGKYFTQFWASVALVSSQALLLIFAWYNRKEPGFWALGLGLLLNLGVIVLNGGLMPISPETIAHYYPDLPLSRWVVGSRLGMTKDIILAAAQTRLWWLSDRFTLPVWVPYQVAFSLGDLLIALGAFLFFWSLGGPSIQPKEENYV